MGGTLGSLSRFLVRLTDLSASASLQEEGTGATTGRKPNGMISDHSDIEHHLHYFMIWKDTEKRRNVLSQIESWS